MPNLLFIDTSGSLATVALLQGNGQLHTLYHEDAQSQAAELNLLINSLLDKSSLSFGELTAICVCGGPGSYTGLRVGLSTAKGIAFACDLKMLLFDKLQLIAASFPVMDNNRKKMVILNARKEEYFYAVYESQNIVSHAATHAFENELKDFARELDQSTFLITDQENLSLGFETTMINSTFKIDIIAWSELALKRISNEEWNDLAYSEPLYLKEAYLTNSKNKTKIS